MNFGTGLKVTAEVIKLLENTGVISPTGEFVEPDTPEKWATLASRVEDILKHYGVHTPDRVDQIIQMLPLIFALVK